MFESDNFYFFDVFYLKEHYINFLYIDIKNKNIKKIF